MKQLLLFTTLLIIFFSCERSKGPVLDTDVSFILDVSEMNIVTDENTSLSSVLRTNANSDNLIENLWVLQFDGIEDGSLLRTKPVYIANVGGIAEAGKIQLVLKGGEAEQTVFFIANTYDTEMCASFLVNTYTLNDLMNLRIVKLTVPIEKGHVPMIGAYNGVIVGATVVGRIKMERLFAKVEFNYEVKSNLLFPEDWDANAPLLPKGQASALMIKTVKLNNSPLSVALSSTRTPLDQIPISPGSVGERDITPAIDGDTKGNCIFYMPENIGGVATPTDAASATLGSGWNDFKVPSDKYDDFDANGEIDPITPSTASYILLSGEYVTMEIDHNEIDPSGNLPDPDTTYFKQNVDFKVYLGYYDKLERLYNNFNVNVNYSYKITNNISTVNSTGGKSTDKRITIGVKSRFP